MYNREYLENSNNSATYSQETTSQNSASLVSFLKATYQLFAGSLLGATAGAYIGLDMAATISQWMLGLIVLEFALLFGVYATKSKPGINLVMLFAFTFISGLTIAPLLASVFMLPGGAAIVAQAFLMTSVAFGGISMFALTTKKDYSGMGKMLFITLIVMIVASLLNFFFQSPIMQLVIASVGAILFSAFILYDTQQIIKGNYSTPVEAAISLYLDFFNLFISLLQILAAFNSSDD
jgi:modulator of FtsH protease